MVAIQRVRDGKRGGEGARSVRRVTAAGDRRFYTTKGDDGRSSRFEIPAGGFALPGQNHTAALLDVARAVVRRAERRSIGIAVEGSHVIPYLNRLSSLLWAAARWQEDESIATKTWRT